MHDHRARVVSAAQQTQMESRWRVARVDPRSMREEVRDVRPCTLTGLRLRQRCGASLMVLSGLPTVWQ